MRIVGYKPLTEAEREALERPVSTDRWFDHHGTRCWVVQSLNVHGHQIGEAVYVHQKSEAIRQEGFLKQAIREWKP